MDKIINIINKYLPPYISIPLILHIVVLSGMLYISHQNYWVSFSKKVNGSLPILTVATTTIIIYLILLVSYILLCFKIRKKLITRLGVLWNQDDEPHCPIHEKPLARHETKINESRATGLDCAKCNKTYQLISDEGKKLTLPEAKKLLKSMRTTQPVNSGDGE
jgi:hypothetical protein